MKKTKFYKMLSEIHNEVADMSDGCMGYEYAPAKVERNDTHKVQYDTSSGKTPYPRRYMPISRKQDYIGNIIRQYVDIEK